MLGPTIGVSQHALELHPATDTSAGATAAPAHRMTSSSETGQRMGAAGAPLQLGGSLAGSPQPIHAKPYAKAWTGSRLGTPQLGATAGGYTSGVDSMAGYISDRGLSPFAGGDGGLSDDEF